MPSDSYVPPEPPDKRVARVHALDVASRLGSKVISHRAYTFGEPQFCYRVPFHAEDFWCTLYLSDPAYKFRINPKRDADSTFCASLKREWLITVGLKVAKILPVVSKELGVDVFTTEYLDERCIAQRLLAPRVKTLLTRIEFPPVRLFFINECQMDFISELITPEHCTQQVRVLRDLLLTLNHEAQGKTGARAT